MNQTDFSQLPLRDIHLPDPIGWWPPAPGWWLLAAFLLFGLGAYAYRHYQGRHRRAALRALAGVRTALEQGAEPVTCLQNVSTVLRRFAMTTAAGTADAPPGVPGLIGEPWLRYLDSRWQRDGFAQGRGRELLAAPYVRPNGVERTAAIELTELCKTWLEAQPVMKRVRSLHARAGD